jgi:hypothetical protein
MEVSADRRGPALLPVSVTSERLRPATATIDLNTGIVTETLTGDCYSA